MIDYRIKPIKNASKTWVRSILTKLWGSTTIVTRGKVFNSEVLPGFVALQKRKYLGLVTYHIQGSECEIVTFYSLKENVGIGTALLNEVKKAAKEKKCQKLVTVTTNDNLAALRWYQKRGFVLKTLYPNVVKFARLIKPQIPKIGRYGIPIRDEIELEMRLTTAVII